MRARGWTGDGTFPACGGAWSRVDGARCGAGCAGVEGGGDECPEAAGIRASSCEGLAWRDEGRVNPRRSRFESGPEARGVGKLENLYYFGSSRMAPQIPDPVIALQAEAPVVERKIADAVCAEIVRRL